jgi:hypothetical protein
MFAIQLLPPTDLGADGERLGEIMVGDFRETFACHDSDCDAMERRWRERLSALVGGDPAVALQYDPRFAWVVYRDGADCFVQERLSLNGDFHSLGPRVTVNEAGELVSEWATTVAAIQRFLAKHT